MSTEKTTEVPLLEGINREGAALRSANQQQEPRPPRERPILFSSEMVRAILDGRKTQTRRVVTDSTSQGNVRPSRCDLSRAFADGGPSPAGNAGPYLHAPVVRPEDHGCVERIYPRYFPGDRLWVRENVWRDERASNVAIYAATPELAKYDDGTRGMVRASHPDNSPPPTREYMQREMESNRFWHLKPSIHMPRWASRIALEITAVRVERVQEMRGPDAVAEGILDGCGDPIRDRFDMSAVMSRHVVAEYRILWNSLNEKRGYGWDNNPWAWVIEFRRG